MKPKALVYSKLPEEVVDYVKEHCEVSSFDAPDNTSGSPFMEALKESEGLLGSGLKVDAAFLDRAPRLRIVSNVSVGYDNLNIPELSSRGIMATNTPGVLNDTVADTIFGLLVATARRMPELDRYVRNGQWKESRDQDIFGIDVHHKTLGIIGLGGIGEKIVQRARFGFDMDVIYHNRSRNPKLEEHYGAVYRTLDELLAEADFVCLMTPLTPETRGMISEREFKLMKKTAIFINGSRGATVDEEALVEALRSGTIRAAGLDVYVQEPLPEHHPLTALDNAVLLPHIGSATQETRLEMAWTAARNLVAGLKGETPANLIQA
ncbi:2-hydroxyacid dehydrogenase [Paenibacillus sabinae]|uniref:Glyoxylate/hydroxypyruvate reductase B n=1 Tax=Paenibacillus sabinae T27 TaxID=1268072 RepID=X4ZXK0_9BACL|nr:D-glycerate dehydrogenase [Paenibacillus sabinae]AHV96414.1 D-isomer specific 2-hydroxyacid dehydrogenase NAD-binding protein [Paenibacillus sabinae T27]